MTALEITRSAGKAALLLATAFLLTENTAHAYLDPGSGSYATQILIASIAGGIFTLKNLISRYMKPIKSAAKKPISNKDSHSLE